MPKPSRRPKNNNLANHREKMHDIYIGLIKKAIAHIESLNGEISMSAVSRVSYEVADKEQGEKGITLPGISTNSEYRALVEHAKANQEVHHPHNRREVKVKYLSDGDIRMMVHVLRTENIELKRTNKILMQQLKDMPDTVETIAPIEEKIIAAHNTIMNVAKSLTNRLCELEITYIDAVSETLKLAHYDEIIVPTKPLKLYYEKELNEIHNKD